MNDHESRRGNAIIKMIAAYTEIMKTLAILPLPVGLPMLLDTVWAEEIETGLVRAHEVIRDIPMNEELTFWARQMIVDWLIGSEFLFRDAEDPAPWKLDLVEFQAIRVLGAAQIVVEELNSDQE